MKKLIIVLLAMAFFFVVVEAKAVAPVTLVAVGGGAGGSAFAPLGVAAIAPIVVFSPYFYQFYKHPECRKEPTIGDMSNCVQYGPTKIQKKK